MQTTQPTPGTTTRTCRKCKKEKSLDEFYRRENGHYRTECKLCWTAKQREYHRNHSTELSQAAWERKLRTAYGIDLAQYNAMLKEQRGRCLLCNGFQQGHRELSVDHCHTTQGVRGLLCTRCNTMIGWIERVGVDVVQDYLKPNGSSPARSEKS